MSYEALLIKGSSLMGIKLVLDVGSGADLPGIVISIMRP